MGVKHVSLKEAVVLPLAPWNKGQGHSYSTFISGAKDMPGLTLERQDGEIAILHEGIKVGGIPLCNIRGYTCEPEETPTVEATEVPTEDPAPEPEAPKRRRG